MKCCDVVQMTKYNVREEGEYLYIYAMQLLRESTNDFTTTDQSTMYRKPPCVILA